MMQRLELEGIPAQSLRVECVDVKLFIDPTVFEFRAQRGPFSQSDSLYANSVDP